MVNPIGADGKLRVTYEDVHLIIADAAQRIKVEYDPELLILISGGGLFPGRVMRTFLKRPSALDPTKLRNIPTQAIGLSLYEEVAGTVEGQIGREVVRTQWLNEKTVKGLKHESVKIEEGKDAGGLLGKRILIVDEVDDSRTTLQYAYQELHRDVRLALDAMTAEERAEVPVTKFATFVVHNKLNEKKGQLPIIQPGQEEKVSNGIVEGIRYFAGEETENVWIAYP